METLLWKNESVLISKLSVFSFARRTLIYWLFVDTNSSKLWTSALTTKLPIHLVWVQINNYRWYPGYLTAALVWLALYPNKSAFMSWVLAKTRTRLASLQRLPLRRWSKIFQYSKTRTLLDITFIFAISMAEYSMKRYQLKKQEELWWVTKSIWLSISSRMQLVALWLQGRLI